MEYTDKKYVMKTIETKPRFLCRQVNPDFTYSYILCSDLKHALKAADHQSADLCIEEYFSTVKNPLAVVAVPVDITYRLRG